MKILIRASILLVGISLASFYGIYAVGFSQCYAKDCNETIFTIWGIIAIILLALGLLAFLVWTFLLTTRDHSKWYLLVITIALYLIGGLWLYFNIFGGKQILKERNFFSQFKTTFYEPSNLPNGWVKSGITYYSEGEFTNGPGNFAKITFKKPYSKYGNDTYFQYLSILQVDTKNENYSIEKFCKNRFGCDVVDGKRIKNIFCQRTNKYLCSVELKGTYIFIDPISNPKILSREEAVTILDSLTAKK